MRGCLLIVSLLGLAACGGHDRAPIGIVHLPTSVEATWPRKVDVDPSLPGVAKVATSGTRYSTQDWQTIGIDRDGRVLVIRFAGSRCLGTYVLVAEDTRAVRVLAQAPTPIPSDCLAAKPVTISLSHLLGSRHIVHILSVSR
jgi:hypothetical protein